MLHNLLTGNQLRQAYLDFFVQQDHAIVPSSLLVPENDPTTLFTTAGMQPMMPYLLGQTHPEGKRIVDSQKCFRAQDIEEVGDNRHTTFFEMLGNWSLGDYFKKEQLTWFFEFLTDAIKLDPYKIFVTTFSGSDKYQIGSDQEAVEIWQELFAKKGINAEVITSGKNIDIDKVQNGRIFQYPADKNWWSRSGEPDNMPTGEPGGPDSEIFYDFGSEFKFHKNSPFANKPCHVNCDCGRFLEIGNSVFMQYQKNESGFIELPQKNIDFGGGLERILASVHHQPDIFQTDLFQPIIKQIENISGKNYEQNQTQFRIIADHVKAAVMLIGDGVLPSNKDQGYMVRRLLRRAIRQGNYLFPSTDFLPLLTQTVIEIYQEPYPELLNQKDIIKATLEQECQKFGKTLAKGLREFKKLMDKEKILSGKIVHYLFETYGFPVEVTLEEAKTQQLIISSQISQEIEQAKKEHASTSRTGAEGKFKGGLADQSQLTTSYHTATHLIHKALRQILGESVRQMGSNINVHRLRFDFSYPQALTQEEIDQVQQLVNNWIMQDLPVNKLTMSKQRALSLGALAFFADRYPDEVSVYVIGQMAKEGDLNTKLQDNSMIISKEFCGGPHVSSTGEIGLIEIFKEKSVSVGVRRIYARKVLHQDT